MKRGPVHFTAEELAWLKKRRNWPRPKLHSAFCKRFDRDGLSLWCLKSLMQRNRWLMQGCNLAGGINHPNSVPIGYERVHCRTGYLERKVCHGAKAKRFVRVHQLNWEEANGPVPEGCFLFCLDGNKLNVDPENWTPVTMSMYYRLIGTGGRVSYYDADPELKPPILTTARLANAALKLKGGQTA